MSGSSTGLGLRALTLVPFTVRGAGGAEMVLDAILAFFKFFCLLLTAMSGHLLYRQNKPGVRHFPFVVEKAMPRTLAAKAATSFSSGVKALAFGASMVSMPR